MNGLIDRLSNQLLQKKQANLFTMIKQYFSSKKNSFTSPFNSSSKKKKLHQADRFIPHSVSKNLYHLFNEPQFPLTTNKPNNTTKNYENLLQQNLLDDFRSVNTGKLLHFGQEPKSILDKQNVDLNLESVYEEEKFKGSKQKKIAKEPYKILDAPMLKDDFYLNLVDWSSQNYIGVGLQSSLFVWSGCSSKVKKLYQSPRLYQQITSVSFLKHSQKLTMGTNQGHIKIFDLHKPSFHCMQNLHSNRIGSISCSTNLIITGSKDGYVTIQDHRMNSQVYRYKAHEQEISGLRISPNYDMIATGGNDNRLLLFSLKTMDKMVEWNQHHAAIKAISFNPKHPSIASGGGTADKKIRIFSLNTFQKITQIDTGSQVCNMRFSPISNQLVTTHGYSLNQIILWKWDQNCQLTKVDSLMGHKNRVLYLAGEYQGSKIVTGAGDQELRLWKIFDQNEKDSIGSYDLR